jgi:hypothetical protein
VVRDVASPTTLGPGEIVRIFVSANENMITYYNGALSIYHRSSCISITRHNIH